MYEKFCFTRDLTLLILVWLQVALALSNMRREKEVRQIQFVGYVNGDREDKKQGGEFVFWPEGANGPRHEVPANP